MNYNDQYSIPFSTPNPLSAEKNSGWSGKKKAGIAVGSIAALAVTFFTGTEVGYNNAKQDVLEAASDTPDSAPSDADAQRPSRSDFPQDSNANHPVILSAGDSAEAPCSTFSPTDEMCMTITLTGVTPDAVCPNPYADAGRYVALDFDASMRSDIGSDFFSPFSAGQWSAITADDRKTNVHAYSACEDKWSYADLSAKFPGYSASGTAWIHVPDNTVELHLAIASAPLFTVSVE
ncbi:hypothetical protein EAH68_13410 [Corynebacterium hylobatis]|uniref:Uncharacterized protein n=1 Tax=Corynebacterium hylobatis TaxID=1859290 RepID=A0A3S0BFW1_9CORY|nr:hypothetical protein [Corynebacterium hylobatis]RSZ61380.1 hypothetical protein EAH68_13410 [Corynebacterium hylobatis]